MTHHDDARSADVERARLAGHGGALEDAEGVLLVQQLQPGVVTDHRRDHGGDFFGGLRGAGRPAGEELKHRRVGQQDHKRDGERAVAFAAGGLAVEERNEKQEETDDREPRHADEFVYVL